MTSPASASGGAAPPSLIYVVRSALEPLRWDELFPASAAQPLEIELGAGDGSFLAGYAALHRERNFVGVERLLGRLRKIDRKGRRLGLTNLRAVRFEAGYLLRYLVPPGSVDALHLYFPDPWPKLKHRGHRLINEAFPGLAAAALRHGGWVHLRTDDADYFAQMERVFGAATGWAREATPEAMLAQRTDFEAEFHARGIPTLHASFRLESGILETRTLTKGDSRPAGEPASGLRSRLARRR